MASTTTTIAQQQPHPPQPLQLPEALVARHAACAPFAGRALDAVLIAALEAEIARRQASVRGLRFLRQVEIDMDNDARAAIAALRICSLCAHCAVAVAADNDDAAAAALPRE